QRFRDLSPDLVHPLADQRDDQAWRALGDAGAEGGRRLDVPPRVERAVDDDVAALAAEESVQLRAVGVADGDVTGGGGLGRRPAAVAAPRVLRTRPASAAAVRPSARRFAPVPALPTGHSVPPASPATRARGAKCTPRATRVDRAPPASHIPAPLFRPTRKHPNA